MLSLVETRLRQASATVDLPVSVMMSRSTMARTWSGRGSKASVASGSWTITTLLRGPALGAGEKRLVVCAWAAQARMNSQKLKTLPDTARMVPRGLMLTTKNAGAGEGLRDEGNSIPAPHSRFSAKSFAQKIGRGLKWWGRDAALRRPVKRFADSAARCPYQNRVDRSFFCKISAKWMLLFFLCASFATVFTGCRPPGARALLDGQR